MRHTKPVRYLYLWSVPIHILPQPVNLTAFHIYVFIADTHVLSHSYRIIRSMGSQISKDINEYIITYHLKWRSKDEARHVTIYCALRSITPNDNQ